MWFRARDSVFWGSQNKYLRFRLSFSYQNRHFGARRLKVPERIQFRLCVLAYRCLIGTAPSYLAETLHLTADVGSRRRLRSASTSTLVIPSTRRTTLGDRAFPVTAARAWNTLPWSVRSAPSLLQFLRDLKTALHVSVIVLFTIVSSCVTYCNF